MGDWEDIKNEINSGGGDYFNPRKHIPVGESLEVTVVNHSKRTDSKFPIRTKEGQSLGYTWSFTLSDGRIWDEASTARKVVLAGLHPGGKEAIAPARFRITNIGKVINQRPAIRVVYLGPALNVPPPAPAIKFDPLEEPEF